MGKPYIPIFLDWLEVTGELNAQEKGRLIDAIVTYARGEDWQEQIKGNERYLFPAFRGQIDRAAEISEIRSKATDSRRNQKQSNAIKTEQTESNEIKNANKEYNKEEEDNKNKKEDSKRHSVAFHPPTVAEVAEYCREKGYGFDAEHFVSYYESNGWRVGKNPMKDWRAACRTWAKNEYSKPGKTKTVAQTDYSQRGYQERQEGELPAWLKEEIEMMGGVAG
jgi:hypothetical protein